MGGNVFPNAVRLDAAAYHKFAANMLDLFKDLTSTVKLQVIKSFKNKESFGDLDILVTGATKEDLQKKLHAYMRDTGCQTPIVPNGPVVSVGYGVCSRNEVFQVDFIFVEPNKYEFAANYFAYNDLGNLIGQTAAGIGLKFGHNGLFYKYIEGSEFLGEILITEDFDSALEILGYSSERYRSTEFNSLEDIFEFASSSIYYSKWNYQLENRNHTGRVRDEKRNTYTKFLEWMKEKDLPSNPPDISKGIFLAIDKYPDVAKQYIQLTLDRQLRNKAKAKFNGASVYHHTGLEMKDLGDFMKYVKSKYPSPQEFYKHIVNMSGPQYEYWIKKEFRTYKAR